MGAQRGPIYDAMQKLEQLSKAEQYTESLEHRESINAEIDQTLANLEALLPPDLAERVQNMDPGTVNAPHVATLLERYPYYRLAYKAKLVDLGKLPVDAWHEDKFVKLLSVSGDRSVAAGVIPRPPKAALEGK
eukprot:NODE_1084_length_611_cov_103.154804_g1011_i0.p1 GENE.NODE_1084_length_611_cov_103.154804_g1011_i0~~NODE_1084_length_611_cov_103.154804_g1011_i0.p1  ORF type:complete len:133 (-),score=31.20 NODE_1084_length_611_cov_103.154804_g1011_i0:182-580(-)